MKGMSVVLGAAARFYAPLIAMFAAILLMTRAPGAGVGVSAGVALALALALHALVFGIDAARTALPPLTTRLIAAVGLLFVVAGAGMPRMPYAVRLPNKKRPPSLPGPKTDQKHDRKRHFEGHDFLERFRHYSASFAALSQGRRLLD